MKKKSKLICAGVAGLMAVAIVGSMGLAFFSDTGETKASAKAGSVTIDVTDLEIENSGNVNPEMRIQMCPTVLEREHRTISHFQSQTRATRAL